MQPDEIKSKIIPWQRTQLSHNSSFVWDDKLLDAASRSLAADTMTLGGGQLGAILQTAFEHNLHRQQLWQLDNLSPYWRKYCALAAQIFLRGVPSSESIACKGAGASGEYPLYVTDSSPESLLSLLTSCFVIADKNLISAWPFLRAHTDFCVTADEARKAMPLVNSILARMTQRHARVAVLGGGITTDVGAFAAYLAHKSFVLVPTSLLAMVDASVGGKCGVNAMPYGKNMLGAFAFPQAVIITTAWLQSLGEEDMLAGAAECLKHALLSGDSLLFAQMCSVVSRRNWGHLSACLMDLIEIKAKIVIEDPLEQGRRSTLNLGHTLAHALEAHALTGDCVMLKHGSAVAVGLLYSLFVSECLGLMSLSHCQSKARQLLISGVLPGRERLHSWFPCRFSTDLWEKLWAFMLRDKKRCDNTQRIAMVLLDDFGGVHSPLPGHFLTLVDRSDAHHAWQKCASFLNLSPEGS